MCVLTIKSATAPVGGTLLIAGTCVCSIGILGVEIEIAKASKNDSPATAGSYNCQWLLTTGDAWAFKEL